MGLNFGLRVSPSFGPYRFRNPKFAGSHWREGEDEGGSRPAENAQNRFNPHGRQRHHERHRPTIATIQEETRNTREKPGGTWMGQGNNRNVTITTRIMKNDANGDGGGATQGREAGGGEAAESPRPEGLEPGICQASGCSGGWGERHYRQEGKDQPSGTGRIGLGLDCARVEKRAEDEGCRKVKITRIH